MSRRAGLGVSIQMLLVAGAAVGSASSVFGDEAPQPQGRRARPATGVYRDRVEPHWFASDKMFWYRNDLRQGTREFVLVDAEQGTRRPAFDHAKLAAALAKAAGKEVAADRLPFDEIEVADDAKSVRFRTHGKTWKCDLADYRCAEDARPLKVQQKTGDQGGVRSSLANLGQRVRQGLRGGEREAKSPDGKWTAFIKDYNVFLRPADGKEATQLSREGTAGNAFALLSWSPDSKTFVGVRVEPGDDKQVHLIDSSPPGGGRAVLSSRPYPLPGDKHPAFEPWVFDVAAKAGKKAGSDRVEYGRFRVRWSKDGRRFTYEHVDRGHQRFRLVEIDARTAAARNLIDERSKTFIWTAHTENLGAPLVTWLEQSNEILYSSEQTGWRRLHLIDAHTGKEKNVVTPEGMVVRGIDHIDEAKRQLWFRACGGRAGQDPYFVHHYRVDFDGNNRVVLTDGNGTHTVQFSPSRKYLVDTYSRVDAPPRTELRRTDDGRLVCLLEDADVGELKARGWTPPEPFVAKARDGKTDIHGVIQKPKDFDPKKKCPVIESIYAGPQGSFVPKAFSPFNRWAFLTDLGFVVVQIDGMGTANRSKAFHDVCWKNLKDAGFPDRVLWHKAVAAKHPWYDAGRVGVYGTSAGGQNAMGAILFHGDFYKAAMAACGCHDNRMDKASWNEQWMGYPVGPHYAACSNVDNAHRLTGKLLLIVGEKDTNVPPESTMRVVDALIKANKDFDLLVMPGVGHSDGGPYGRRRMQDFFTRHLLGAEPPDRNKPAAERRS